MIGCSAGGTDELPNGPEGFDVLDEAGYLIADPLRRRIVVYDAQGAYRQEWKIGFGADSVTAMPAGLVQVREASTGEIFVFDREGKPRQGGSAAPPAAVVARVLTPKTGTVARPTGQPGPLEVKFDKPGLMLLSLEGLGTDSQGNTFVALEATGGGDDVNVNKYVRKYGPQGNLISEIADIPLDYFVHPVNELRVHNGRVYQLMTTNTEVRINIWNTN